MATDARILAVAQLRPDGTVTFLQPYELQLRLRVWQLVLPRRLPAEEDHRSTILTVHPSVLGLDGGDLVLFLAQVPKDPSAARLAIITRRSSLHLPNAPFALFNDGRPSPFLASGDSAWSTWKAEPIALDGARYTVRFPHAPVPLPNRSATPTWTAIIALLGLCFFLHQQFATILNARDSLEERLGSRRAALEEGAQRIAHDLRNVALGLKSLNASISVKHSAAEMQRFDSLITDLGGYTQFLSTRLVAEVLGYSDQQILETQTYLRAAVETVASQVGVHFDRRLQLAYDESLATREPFVSVPAAELSRILANVLRNAVEACDTSPQPHISVSARREGERVKLVVTDNGCGITPELQSTIFDDGISTKGAGRGNGLPSARERARRFGGDIALVESAPNKGTSIELDLPLVDTPPWFVNTLEISSRSVIVVVDDEDVAYEYWSKLIGDRFAQLNVRDGSRPRLVHVKDALSLGVDSHLLKSATHFLVDYHFEGSAATGLDVIRQHGLGSRALLVTNFFEKQAVVEEALKLGVRILPKIHVLNARLNITLEGP